MKGSHDQSGSQGPSQWWMTVRMESDVTDLEAGGIWPIGDVMETPVVSGNLWEVNVGGA